MYYAQLCVEIWLKKQTKKPPNYPEVIPPVTNDGHMSCMCTSALMIDWLCFGLHHLARIPH